MEHSLYTILDICTRPPITAVVSCSTAGSGKCYLVPYDLARSCVHNWAPGGGGGRGEGLYKNLQNFKIFSAQPGVYMN